MATLTHQRCFNHAVREAAARCPECTRYFCRECVTEHDDRVICAACLRRLVKLPLTQRSGFRFLVRAVQFATGFVLAWLFFHGMGRALLRLPSSFHDGTLWK